MPRPVLLLALLLLLPAGPVAAHPAVEEAARLVATYHEDLARLDRARGVLEAALAKERRVETMTLLARVCYLIGDLRAATPDDKLAAYERGRELAQRAIELAPRSEDAHFFYLANTGRWGQTKGIMRSLFLVPTVRETIETLLALNGKSARTHGAAASFLFELPRLVGGDREKAEAHWKKAFELDPHYTAPRVEYARYLISAGRPADARRELQAVLDEKAPSIVADWTVKDVPKTRTLLESLRDRK
jgi:tetratricopeptide (TPR) repeat protein